MYFFFSSRRRHTRCSRDWSSDVCSSDLSPAATTTPTRVNQPVSLRAPASLDGWSPVVWAVSLSTGWRSRSSKRCEIFVPAARREWSDDLVGPGGGLAEPSHRVRREPPRNPPPGPGDLSVCHPQKGPFPPPS